MSRRTLAAAAGVVAALALGTVPALAAGYGGFDAPSDGARFSSAPTIRGGAHLDGGIDAFTFTISPQTGGGSPISVNGNCGAAPAGFACPTADDLTIAWTPDFAYNGTYTVSGSVTHTRNSPLDQDETVTFAPRSFAVEIAPIAPRSLQSTADPGSRSVTLSWRQNPEPDLTGYLIYRAYESGPAQPLTQVPAGRDRTVSYTDTTTSAGGGRYTYSVAAVRRDASGGSSSGVAGPPSSTSVTVVGPPPTTTTVPPSTSSSTPGSTSSSTPGTTDASTSSVPGFTPIAPGDVPRSGRVDLSAFRAVAAAANIPPLEPPDPGFDERLPYSTTTGPSTTQQTPPQAALPVQASFQEESGNQRAMLTFLAGAMVLFMLSMHLRWLLRRTEPDPL